MSDVGPERATIVVGLDHTPAASAALRWALQEGVRRGMRVRVVHVYDRTRVDLAHARDHEGRKQRERIEVHRQLSDVMDARMTDVAVAVVQEDGPVSGRLVEAAQHAALVVLGAPTAHGHDRIPELVAAAVDCPVVVVDERGEGQPVAATAG
jgi:nucleotide-binding universal stress UspA family protein